MEAQVAQPDTARRCPTAAIFSAMDMETVQMLVTPGKQDLQDRMEVRQGGIAVHEHATPDERADASQDDPQLVDAEWCSSGSHALRVAQRIRPLKGSPRYLALSLYPQTRQLVKHGRDRTEPSESSMSEGPYRGEGHTHQQGPSVEHPTKREACQGSLAAYDR